MTGAQQWNRLTASGNTWWRTLLIAVAAMLLLVSCDEEPPQKVERIRAIKPYYVIEPAGGDVRRYSGTIVASNTSALSFAVSGTVQTVTVNKGDHVKKGQILATLDAKPFNLNVEAAQAERAAAQAELDNTRVELERQKKLLERGWVAKAAYDRAVAAFEAAEGQLNLARSRVGLAERDVAKTRLTAPFDGVIAQRDVEPFVEVKTGQTVFQLDSEGALEVDLSIPDTIVGRLSIGTPVTINASTVAGCGCAGRITEIGSKAGEANTVPVTAAILESPRGLLPGMAVEASVVLSDDGGPRGYLVPLVAIAPGDGEGARLHFQVRCGERYRSQDPGSKCRRRKRESRWHYGRCYGGRYRRRGGRQLPPRWPARETDGRIRSSILSGGRRTRNNEPRQARA